MADTYTVNLNKAKMASRNKRAGRAINILKEFIEKHVGSDFKISKNINEEIWKRGANKPPKSITVEVTERGEDFYWIDLPGMAQEDVKEVEEEAEQEVSEEEKEEQEQEEEDKKVDLPEEVKEALKDGTIGDGKDALKKLNKSEFEKALDFEEKHQNRKGMKQFIESNMR